MVRLRFDTKLNNKGASLIFALVAIVFVTLLASTVMAAAMANLTLKRVELQSKRSFYTAETAVDEIYAGLGKLSLDSMNQAYVYELSSLVDESGAMKETDAANQDMKYRFIAEYLKSLTGNTATLDAGGFFLGASCNDAVKNTISASLKDPAKILVKSISSIKAYANEPSGYSLTICDAVVSYESSEGFFADITTDFVISYPDIKVEFSNNNPKDFLDYCLVADANVALGDDSLKTAVSFESGIYAGKDFNVNGASTGTLKNALRSVVHGNVRILSSEAEKSALSVGNTTFWTEGDIRLDEKTSGDGAEFRADADAALYVQDDLEFNGEGCMADIAGNYYGYGSGGAAAANASMIMNARGGSLSVHVGELFLLGHAYVDVNNGITMADSYETGESVSVKKNQEIYLVLDEYLKNSTKDVTNPISAGKVPAPDGNGNYTTLIDYDKLKNFFAYDLLDSVNPVILVTDSVRSASYFYYHFSSEKNLEAYALAVQSGMLNGVDVRSNPSWTTENMVMSKCVSTGTISVNATAPKILGTWMNSLNPSLSFQNGTLTQTEAANEALAVRSKLAADYGMMAKKEVFDEIVNVELAKKETSFEHIYSEGGNDWHLRVVNTGNYDVPVGDSYGILIHTGTGTVKVPHDYTGLILSNGTIQVSGDALITSDREKLEEILNADFEFAKFFQAYYTPPSGASSSIDSLTYADFVSIANWRKFDDSAATP